MQTDAFVPLRELRQTLSAKREAPLAPEQGRPNLLSLADAVVAPWLLCKPTLWIN